jgi:two-component system OmpR family response regulator
MLAAALRHNGFTVSAACSGREALKAMGGPPHPDLVVLDVMMPDLDGFEVCRRMRADGDGTPVLFLTARDSITDLHRHRWAGRGDG